MFGKLRTVTDAAQAHLGATASELERALGAIRTVRAMRNEASETERVSACAEQVYASSLSAVRADAIISPAPGTGPLGELSRLAGSALVP